MKRVPAPRRLHLLLAAFLAISAFLAPASPSGSLRVAAVQLSMDVSLLDSAQRFSDHVEALVGQAMAFRPDLVVFPEYTSVFLALLPYGGEIRGSRTADQALARIRAREPLVRGLRELFLLNSGLAGQAMQEIFGGLARRHGVSILAGSFFAWDNTQGRVRLVNRAVLYGPDGRVAYSQDKVFLTPFEVEVLGLEPGALDDAAPFPVNGRPVGLSICRDTFFEQWRERLAGSLLWIDIKANGERFDAEEQERFRRALPARIAAGPVPYGLTVCLTGRLLELFWEGESSLVRGDGRGGVQTLARSSDPLSEQLLLVEVPPSVDPASARE